ncbi:MAG: hypothetical protein R3330_10940, partial [Saprospiraceae bacterium]|nr:hypothetical protein [Saprospiraceae bacterium]
MSTLDATSLRFGYMLQKAFIVVCLTWVLLNGCGDPEPVTIHADRVEPALQPYFLSFVQEASRRGIDVGQSF